MKLLLEASDLVVLPSTKLHTISEATLLIAEYRVSMLSGTNLTSRMEQVKRECSLSPVEGLEGTKQAGSWFRTDRRRCFSCSAQLNVELIATEHYQSYSCMLSRKRQKTSQWKSPSILIMYKVHSSSLETPEPPDLKTTGSPWLHNLQSLGTPSLFPPKVEDLWSHPGMQSLFSWGK